MSGLPRATITLEPGLPAGIGSELGKHCPICYLVGCPVIYPENKLTLAKHAKEPRPKLVHFHPCPSAAVFCFLLFRVSLNTVHTIYLIAVLVINCFHLVPGTHNVYSFLLKLSCYFAYKLMFTGLEYNCHGRKMA